MTTTSMMTLQWDDTFPACTDNCTPFAWFNPLNDTHSSSSSAVLKHPSVRAPKGDDQLLMLYALPIIVIAGTIGNALSFAVLMRPCMRFTSVYFYLLVLSCADTLVLYVSAFKTWIRLLTDFELLHLSNASCKLLVFILLVSMYLSAWLIVFMTVDRFVAVWFPFRAAAFCNIARARLATVVLLAITFALNCHVFWTISLYQIEGPMGTWSRMFCGPDMTSQFMFGPFEKMKLISYSIIPFAIILCLNVAIIVRLRYSTPSVLQLPDDTHRVGFNRCTGAHHPILRHVRDPYSQTRVTSMLLAVSFTWVLLTCPYSFYGMTYVLAPRQNMVVKGVCFILMYTNHAINFALYCLTGRKFRRELIELFTRAMRRRRRSTHNASPSVKTQRTSNMIELDIGLPDPDKNLL